jgi:hypothetical protein
MAHAKDHCRVNTGDCGWKVGGVKVEIVMLKKLGKQKISFTASVLPNLRRSRADKSRDIADRLWRFTVLGISAFL